MNLLREYISELLSERDDRKNKTKRILYHINKYRPARPQPKMNYLQQWDKDAIDPDTGERTGDLVDVPGTDNWDRWWIESPVKSGVFLTPNPVDIAMNHGRSGHVYAYRVPEWVIEKSGGLHRYDTGSEVLIPEDIWNKAGKEIEFLGKSMDHDELHAKIDKTQTHGRGSKRKPTKPSWLSDEELKAWEDRQKQFNITGLRSTKHPADAIKILSQEEVKSAIAAIESEYSPKPDKIIPAAIGDRKGIKLPDFQKKVTKKDEELLALLKKRLNETAIRAYIRELLSERANFKLKGSAIYFRVELPGIGYAEGGENLRFKECQSDVDKLMQTPEYLAAEKKYQETAKPRTSIVKNEETGKYEDIEVGPAIFRPRFYDVNNAWIKKPENRGKGYGKQIYKAFIDQAVEYSKNYGGVFIGAHHCTIGSGTSDDAKRVWASLAREYNSSGDVIFIGL